MRQYELRRRAVGHHHRRRPSTYRVSQGTRLARAATIEITADTDGTVWVSGAATVCIQGSIIV